MHKYQAQTKWKYNQYFFTSKAIDPIEFEINLYSATYQRVPDKLQ